MGKNISDIDFNLEEDFKDSHDGIERVDNINKKLNNSEDVDSYRYRVCESIIYANNEFSLYYNDLWLKRAEEDSYLIEWIDRLSEKEFSPENIRKAVDDYLSEGHGYPPNLNDFINICKELESYHYNIPTKEEGYMIASGLRDIDLKHSHPVVRETTRRIGGDYRVRSEAHIKTEFYRVYKEVRKEYIEAEGNVPFNDKINLLKDFVEDKNEDPPLDKEKALKHIRDILGKEFKN